MKYIIDTDPGIDDTIGIVLGYLNNLDIIGFTLATGNIELSKAENNLKVTQDFLGSNIKMYRGKTINKCNLKKAEYAHGKDGLGYAVFPKNSRKIEKMCAEDFIIKASKKYKDDLTLICFGPLTNLANAIKKDKKLSKRLKHVLVMGTAFDPDSDKRYIEFNVNVDPEAAITVFKEPFSDIRIVTHELGVKSFVEKEYVNSLKDSESIISRFIYLISQKYIEFSYNRYGTIGLGTPDPTTISSLIDSSIIDFKPCLVDIVYNEDKKAECHIKLTDKSNIKVSVDFDLEKFRKVFKDTFK